jgi:hypothetical protein
MTKLDPASVPHPEPLPERHLVLVSISFPLTDQKND